MQGAAAVLVSGWHIRAGLDKQFEHRQAGKLRGGDQRRGSPAIACVHIRALGQKQSHDLKPVFVGGPMQRGSAKLVSPIRIRALGQEQSGDRQVRTGNCLVKQRVTGGIGGIGRAWLAQVFRYCSHVALLNRLPNRGIHLAGLTGTAASQGHCRGSDQESLKLRGRHVSTKPNPRA